MWVCPGGFSREGLILALPLPPHQKTGLVDMFTKHKQLRLDFIWTCFRWIDESLWGGWVGGRRGWTGYTDEEAGGLEVSGFEVTEEVLKEYSPAAV